MCLKFLTKTCKITLGNRKVLLQSTKHDSGDKRTQLTLYNCQIKYVPEGDIRAHACQETENE